MGLEGMEEMQLLFSILNIIITILIFAVNTPLVLIVYRKPRLMRTVSNKILFSLVLADLVVGSTSLLHLLLMFFARQYIWYRVFLDLFTLTGHILLILHLSMTVCERYISLVHPYKTAWLTTKKARHALAGVWLFSFTYPLIQLLWLYRVLDGKWTEAEDRMIRMCDCVFSVFSICVFFVVPVNVLALLFLRMYTEIKQISNYGRAISHRKTLNTFSIMFALFVVLTLPYFAIRLLIDIASMKRVPYVVTGVTYLLKLLPTAVNPFIYIFKKADFKKELLEHKDGLSRMFSSGYARPSSSDGNNNLDSKEQMV